MKTRRPQPPTGHPKGEAARVADQLRETREGALDEVSLARMERSLLQAWRVKASHVESFPRRRARRASTAWIFGSAVAGAAALGAIIGLLVLEQGPVSQAMVGGAQFEMRLGEGAIQRGAVTEGQTLESGRYGHIQVDLGRTRVEVEPRARVRFDRISQHHIQLTVIEGAIEAQFNPEHTSERTMAVETRAARVVVVGTRFQVAVDGQGNTRVAVREGIVDVLPRAGKRQRLTAGQRTEVLLDAGDAAEQAVREAIAARLSESEPLAEELDPAAAEAAEAEGMALAAPAVRSPSARTGNSGRRGPAAGEARLDKDKAELRLESARDLLRDGRHQVARRKLRQLADASSLAPMHRAEALTLIAESYTSQGHIPRAAESYREAAEVAAGAPAGHNAVFALARLLERYTQDTDGAIAAYARYLRQAPSGALAGQARRGLCRLGEEQHCKRPAGFQGLEP